MAEEFDFKHIESLESKVTKEKYVAIFLLHALGDTIGFKNGDWKLNYNETPTFDSVNEHIYEFIDLGGVNGIDLTNWLVSDSTLYSISIAKSLLKYDLKSILSNHGDNGDNIQFANFLITVKNNIIVTHNKMAHEESKAGVTRYPDKITNIYVTKFTESTDGYNLPYDKKAFGCDPAMRNLSIGLLDIGLEELVFISVRLGKMTHNSPHGYLGGFAASFFAYLAARECQIEKWPFLLIDVLESEMVKKHVDTKNIEEMGDYVDFVRFWQKYVDTRFVDQKPIKSRSISNVLFRTKYYHENFVKDTPAISIGESGCCSMIISYDSLLDCDGKWEKLIFYGMVHPGMGNVTGSIAGGLYGLLYGFGDVPQKMLCCIEEKNQLLKLGEQFHKKFEKK